MVLGVVGVLIGGFVFALWFGAQRSSTGDAAYTATADEVQVVSSETEVRYLGTRKKRTSGQQTAYVYRAGSTWYVADAWVDITPGTYVPESGPLVTAVCFDPEDPAEHGLLLREGARCGDGSIGRVDSADGKPTAAP